MAARNVRLLLVRRNAEFSSRTSISFVGEIWIFAFLKILTLQHGKLHWLHVVAKDPMA